MRSQASLSAFMSVCPTVYVDNIYSISGSEVAHPDADTSRFDCRSVLFSDGGNFGNMSRAPHGNGDPSGWFGCLVAWWSDTGTPTLVGKDGFVCFDVVFFDADFL